MKVYDNFEQMRMTGERDGTQVTGVKVLKKWAIREKIIVFSLALKHSNTTAIINGT